MQFWRHCKPKRKNKAKLRHHGYEKHLFDKEEVPGLIKLQKPKKSKKNDVFWIYWQKEHTLSIGYGIWLQNKNT